MRRFRVLAQLFCIPRVTGTMTERSLFSSELVTIVDFTCPPEDEAWRSSTFIASPDPLIVFPRCPVAIRQANGERILATPNLVMLYNPAQEFQRELRDAKGDSCIYLRLHPRLLDSLERDVAIVAERRLRATHAPTTRADYLRQHLLSRYLGGTDVDPLLVEETVARLSADVLGRRHVSRRRRGETKAAHYELAEAAKERIVATLAQPLSLNDLAAELRVSPFHLARVFRAETGFAMHQYRKQLRLRIALDRLREGAPSLTSLAFDLGFASHSHFTDAFRAEFGVAPSAVRDPRVAAALLAA